MERFQSTRRPVLVLAALVFAACTLFYSSLWALYSAQPVRVELGFDNKYLPLDRSQLVRSVVPGSPAEQAGIKAGMERLENCLHCGRWTFSCSPAVRRFPTPMLTSSKLGQKSTLAE